MRAGKQRGGFEIDLEAFTVEMKFKLKAKSDLSV